MQNKHSSCDDLPSA